MLESLTHLITFLLGCALVYWLKRAELKNLYRINRDLLGTMYARIGYKPEPDKPIAQPEATVKTPPEKYTGGMPDVLAAQAQAIQESDKKYNGMPLNDWLALTPKQQQEIQDAKPT